MKPKAAKKRSGSPSRPTMHRRLCVSNRRRIKVAAEQGFQKIKILRGTDWDCPACARLEGRIFPISEAPAVPPEDCTCLPHCSCVLLPLARA